MEQTNLARAESYYAAFAKKDIAAMESHFHPNVHFIGAFAEITGKEAVMEGFKPLLSRFETVRVRGKFAQGDQVMMVYDLICPPPVGAMRIAALLRFQDGLISELEVFFDSAPLRAQD